MNGELWPLCLPGIREHIAREGFVGRVTESYDWLTLTFNGKTAHISAAKVIELASADEYTELDLYIANAVRQARERSENEKGAQ